MAYLIKSFLSLIQLLHSQNGERSIAIGVCFGCVLGFSPVTSPLSLLLLFLSLCFKVQIGAMLLGWLFFSLLAFLLSFITEPIGYALLSNSSLNSLWASFFSIPGSHFTQLNNSLVLGGFVFSVSLSPFIYLLTKALILKYRLTLGEKINQSKLLKLIKTSKLYNLYHSYANL